MPKGSFYFYFQSKEELGIHIVDYFLGFFLNIYKETIGDRNLTSLEKLNFFFDTFLKHFEDTNFQKGCPIGNLAQEMSGLSEAFRRKLQFAMDTMERKIADLLEEAKGRGEISRSIDAAETAIFVLSSWEGTIIRMKISKSSLPYETFKKMVFQTVLTV